MQNIDAYGICGVRNERASNLTVEDSFLLYKLDYSGSPFLTFTEIDDGVTVSPYYFKYYQNGVEIEADQLEAVLGAKCVEGAPNSGTSSAELGMFNFVGHHIHSVFLNRCKSKTGIKFFTQKISPSTDGLILHYSIFICFRRTFSVRNASAILTRSGTMNGKTHMPSAEA